MNIYQLTSLSFQARVQRGCVTLKLKTSTARLISSTKSRQNNCASTFSSSKTLKISRQPKYFAKRPIKSSINLTEGWNCPFVLIPLRKAYHFRTTTSCWEECLCAIRSLWLAWSFTQAAKPKYRWTVRAAGTRLLKSWRRLTNPSLSFSCCKSP